MSKKVSKTAYYIICLCFLFIFIDVVIIGGVGCIYKNHTLFIWGIVLNAIFLMILFFGILELNDFNDVCHLLKGENRKMRKKNRKILELEAEKKYLEQEKEKNEKINTLNCKIHSLELELKEGVMICKFCGAKIFKKACYCSKCGEAVK